MQGVGSLEDFFLKPGRGVGLLFFLFLLFLFRFCFFFFQRFSVFRSIKFRVLPPAFVHTPKFACHHIFTHIMFAYRCLTSASVTVRCSNKQQQPKQQQQRRQQPLLETSLVLPLWVASLPPWVSGCGRLGVRSLWVASVLPWVSGCGRLGVRPLWVASLLPWVSGCGRLGVRPLLVALLPPWMSGCGRLVVRSLWVASVPPWVWVLGSVLVALLLPWVSGCGRLGCEVLCGWHRSRRGWMGVGNWVLDLCGWHCWGWADVKGMGGKVSGSHRSCCGCWRLGCCCLLLFVGCLTSQ